MGMDSDIQAILGSGSFCPFGPNDSAHFDTKTTHHPILDDENEPFETADQLIEATYLLFGDEMRDEPMSELWEEAIAAVRGADHDATGAALDAIENLVEQARARIRSIEEGTAWQKHRKDGA